MNEKKQPLTKEEKVKRLELLSSRIYNKTNYMCVQYRYLFDGDLFIDIPEILNFKPFKNFSKIYPWFPKFEWKKRIEIIQETIKQVKRLPE